MRRETSGLMKARAALAMMLRRCARPALGIAVTAATLATVAVRLTPLPAALEKPMVQSLEIVDRNGVTLRNKRIDERFARAISANELPQTFRNAILAAEDKRFFAHRGVDWLAVARAFWTSLRAQRITSGASTITQQLVKVSEPRPRTWSTKLVEMLTALRLEQSWTKEQILAAYLNRIEFGNLNHGVASAAEYYFGKPVDDLSHAEAAFLAGLPINPTRLNPHTALAAARRRQQTVLRRMRENGMITNEEFARATGEELRLRAPRRAFRAPHFVDLILRMPRTSGEAKLRTTLDLELNATIERIVAAQVAHHRRQNLRHAAAVVIDNGSGDVLALVGSEDYFGPRDGQNNGAMARRSAGSTLKPFVYLLALERGATPATIFADVPTVFTSASGLYRPENYNRRCHGPMRLRLALGNSLNIPAVKALAAIGGPSVLQQRLRAWGITTLDQPPATYGLGLAIGNAEVRLLELTNAYAALARLGEYQPCRLIADEAPPQVRPFTERPSPEHAWLIADILRDNAARTLAFGANSPLRFDFPVACKTGTSTDYRDNWAMGYTPEFTVGVWAGNFDGAPMGEVSGVTGAAPILHEIFDYLHQRFGTNWFQRPPQIVTREIHPLTGKLVTESRPEQLRENFALEHLPELESATDYDAAGRVVLKAEYHSWLDSAQNGLLARAVASDAQCELRIVSPLPGSTYIVDPDVPTTRRVPLIAAGGSKLFWQSTSLECREMRGAVHAVAAEGEHRLTLIDAETGAQAETWIRVKSL